jgi:hypothetical protein
MSAIERMEALGRAGITVSVCCGPCGTLPFRWSVQATAAVSPGHFEEFEMPYAANSFEHAIEIAELEVVKRGWQTGKL